MTDQLPTDVNSMIQLIESGYDRPGLVAALEAAQAQADHAAQQLGRAQAQLQAHEGARPTDPSAWPAWTAERRQLADVLPIYQELADVAAGELEARRRAIGDARLTVFTGLRAQLRTQSQAAVASDSAREDELRAELDAIRAGKSPAFQAVIMAEIALNNAAGALRNVN